MEPKSEGMTFIQGDSSSFQFYGRAFSFPRSSFAFTEDPGVASVLRTLLDNPSSSVPSLLFVNSDVPDLLWLLMEDEAREMGRAGEVSRNHPLFISKPGQWKGMFSVGQKGNYEIWFRVIGPSPLARFVKVDDIPFLVEGSRHNGWEKMVLSFEGASFHTFSISIPEGKSDYPPRGATLEWLIVNELDVKEISGKLDRCRKSWLFFPKITRPLYENYFTTSSSETNIIASDMGFQKGDREAFSPIPLSALLSESDASDGGFVEPVVFFQDGFSHPVKYLVPSFSGRWRPMGSTGKLLVYNPSSKEIQCELIMNLVAFNESKKVTLQIDGEMLSSVSCKGPKYPIPSFSPEEEGFRSTGEGAGPQVRWTPPYFYLKPGFNEIGLSVDSNSGKHPVFKGTRIALNDNIFVRMVSSSIPRSSWPKNARFNVQNNGREIVLVKDALSGPDTIFWGSSDFEKVAVLDYPFFFMDAYSFGGHSPLEVGFTIESGDPPGARLMVKTPFPFEGDDRGEKILRLADELRDRGIDPRGSFVSRVHFFSRGEKRPKNRDEKFHIRFAGFFKEKGEIVRKEEMDLRSSIVRSSCPISTEFRDGEGLLIAVKQNAAASVMVPFDEKPRPLPSTISIPFQGVHNKIDQLSVDLLAECDTAGGGKEYVSFGENVPLADWKSFGWSPSSDRMIFRSLVPDGMLPEILNGNLILKRDDAPLVLLPQKKVRADFGSANFFIRENYVYVGLPSGDSPKLHNFRLYPKTRLFPTVEDPNVSEVRINFRGDFSSGCRAKGLDISFVGKASFRNEDETAFGIQPPRLVDVGILSEKDLRESALSPSLEMDGKPISFSSVTFLTGRNSVLASGTISSPIGEHAIRLIRGVPMIPHYVEIFSTHCPNQSEIPEKKIPFLIRRLNPTKYLANFIPEQGEEGENLLILNQNFDPGWQAYAVSNDGKKKRLLHHFRINGFANAWIVPSVHGQLSTPTLTYELVFKPQRKMEFWIYLSFSTWIFCIAALSFFLFSRKSNSFFSFFGR